ncbi:MAG: helix-turn-helix domain-containing protein [Rhizobium sp.]|nr:helix-turn-helix domain-containing protein [Rhizobium sp.]
MNVHVSVLTIGVLAKATGLTTPTIRYYEEIGLLPAPKRTDGGQRHYHPSDVERLTFIKQCRDFGFSIERVRTLLDLSVSRERDCSETRDIAKAHLDEVQAKLRELRALELRLKGFVRRCDEACSGGPGADCVIFGDLSQGCNTSCCA